MRRDSLWALSLAACVLTVVLFTHNKGNAQQPPNDAAERPNRPAAARWQYAMYYVAANGAASWNDGREKLADDDAYALYRRFGGEAPRENFSLVDLFHLFGQEGWELTMQDTEGTATVYWFKRRG